MHGTLKLGIAFPLLVWFLQVLAITNAKRVGAKQFVFPGDSQVIGLKRDVAYFITMNPGYQGRQELPENLKVPTKRTRGSVTLSIREHTCSDTARPSLTPRASFTPFVERLRVIWQKLSVYHHALSRTSVLSLSRSIVMID